MKKNIFFLLLLISNILTLNAQEPLKAQIKAFCSDAKKDNFLLSINSNRLNLSEDAIQDNLGGYVDIPDDNYYIKTQNTLFHLKGVVEHNTTHSINQFTYYTNTKELQTFINTQNLKFIQKINLQNSSKGITTKIILNIYLDKQEFHKEYQKCKEQMKQIKDKSFFQMLFDFLET